MIFISVGTADKGFDRLLQACDKIAAHSATKFFAQTGYSEFVPTYIKSTRWLSREQMKACYKQATSFIIHGGFGTISEVIRFNKPIIVVPRSFSEKEAVNDQYDLCRHLSRANYVHCVENVDHLESVLKNIALGQLRPFEVSTQIPELIAAFIKGEMKKNN